MKTRSRRIRPAAGICMVTGLICLLLTGCWDRIEINDIAIVMATGIDKEKNGYRVSVYIPLPVTMLGSYGGGAGGTTKSYMVESEFGTTVIEARDRLQHRLSRRLFFGHRRVILVGEELAQEEGLVYIMDEFLRVVETRLSSYMVVTKGKAIDMLQTSPKLEKFTTDALRELLRSDIVIPTTLEKINKQLHYNGYEALLPYMERKKVNGKPDFEQIQVTGYAVTKDGKLIDIAKGDRFLGLRWFTMEFRSYMEVVRSDKVNVGLLIRRGRVSITPRLDRNGIRFHVRAIAQATVMESLDGCDYGMEENVRNAENALRDKIAKELGDVVALMKDRRSDVAGFGYLLSKTYPRKWRTEWEAHWYEMLPEIPVQISVEATIFRPGLFMENNAKRQD